MQRRLLAGVSVVLVGVASVFSRPSAASRLPEKRLGSVRAIGALQPRISPGGDRIAFSYQGAIWRIDRSGGAMTRLTRAEGFDIEPAWSPDGKQIAFLSSRNGFSGNVQRIDASDGAPRPLPAAVQAQGKLHFQPDGRRILGSFQIQGQPESLAWLDCQSGALEPVLNPPRSARRLSLSNDGQWIAFATTLDIAGEQSGNDGPQNVLWRVSARGGEPEAVVRFPSRIYDTCWSEDGRSIYATTDLGGAHYDIWEVPLDNPLRRMRQRTFGQADEDRPSLSADGRWLAYIDNRDGSTQIVVHELATGDEQTLGVTGLDFGQPSGTLRLRVIDQSTRQPTVARVTIEERPGKFHAPLGALVRVERNNGHFYCRNDAEVTLPPGTYQLRAFRGPEYRGARREIRIEAGKVVEETIELERWNDFKSSGYYSGENHIHANYGYGEWYNTPRTMLDQCEGEDLNVCNFMVANSDGDGVFDRSFFRGEPDPLSNTATVLYWNQEFRSTIWGHMTLVNLRQVVEPVFTGFKDTTNPWDTPSNADVADRTHLQGGHVNYTHPAQNVDDPYLGAYTAKALPVDVALGRIDSMDVMGSNHRAAVPLWYRLLNCGFRLPASAGTDVFLNRVRSRLPGSDRAYVAIPGEFSYSAWIDGLRAGRSFVSNGPLLEIDVDGKLRPGATLELAAPQDVRVVCRARSLFPIERLELVMNGQVVATQQGQGNDTLQGVALEQSVRVDRTGWLAARAVGPAQPDHTGFELYAHTSPVYVEVKGKPVSARSDAQFFLAWIDRLHGAIRQRDRIPSAELKARAESQMEAARAIYRKIAESGGN
jgi:TolB protein